MRASSLSDWLCWVRFPFKFCFPFSVSHHCIQPRLVKLCRKGVMTSFKLQDPMLRNLPENLITTQSLISVSNQMDGDGIDVEIFPSGSINYRAKAISRLHACDALKVLLINEYNYIINLNLRFYFFPLLNRLVDFLFHPAPHGIQPESCRNFISNLKRRHLAVIKWGNEVIPLSHKTF